MLIAKDETLIDGYQLSRMYRLHPCNVAFVNGLIALISGQRLTSRSIIAPAAQREQSPGLSLSAGAADVVENRQWMA
jgi:hypothetical protein